MSIVVEFKCAKRDTPRIENGQVAPPRRVTNLERRSREHLTPAEVERLIAAAAKGRKARIPRRGADPLPRGTLHVHRKKNGEAATHPRSGRELRALRQLKHAYPESPFLFVTERGGPITEATVRKMISRAGDNAGLEFPIHPHMLRHATGYYLANSGVDTRTIQPYLGHRNIMHTVRYTQLAPDRFRTLWRD